MKQAGIKYIMLVLGAMLLLGCRTIHEVPVEHQVIYVYRDSLRIKDSTIVIPIERIVDVVRDYDTLRMETSMAAAKAWLDTTTKTLKGELENKEGVKYVYRDREKIVYRDSLVYKDVPVEVIKKTHYPYEKWLWVWCILSLFLLGIWIYRKFSITLPR